MSPQDSMAGKHSDAVDSESSDYHQNSHGPPPSHHGGGVEQIPGTVHLVDLEHRMRAKHAHASHHRDVVLIPTPSADPDDPLNWSPRRKLLSTTCMGVYTLMVGIASAAIYSILEPISDDTGLTLDQLNNGTGYMFLFFGLGCLVWQPLALQYGKRPVYLFSILATCLIQIWAPYTRNNGQWIANKILQGFFGAPIESLCEISVTDVYFQHERGAYIGLYGFLLAGSNFLAPILAGFIDDGQGWKWVLYWCAIFNAVGFVFLCFFMEETNYPDRMPATDGQPSTPDSSAPLSSPPSAPFDPEKHSTTSISPYSAPSITQSNSRKTYLTKLLPFQSRCLTQPNNLLPYVTRPLVFLTFPIIAYAGFSYGSNLIWFNVLNGTASSVLSSPPYAFPAHSVGLAYVSPLIGTAFAALYAGPLGDAIVLRLARRRGGILEPEYRLWLFAPSLLIVPGGLLLWGVGAAAHIPWPAVVFAMGVIAFSNTVGLALSVAYAVDSYRALGAEAVVTVILVRNTMSFAIGWGIVPWVSAMGLRDAFITAAAAGLAQVATVFVFIRWGKAMRKASTARYARYAGAAVH